MLHTTRSTGRLRTRLLVAALLAVPAVVLATPGTADAAATRDRADAAAGWLGRQLNADHVMTVSVDVGGSKQTFTDYGLTADTVRQAAGRRRRSGQGRARLRQRTAQGPGRRADRTGMHPRLDRLHRG
jgi:hypothetical protein